jgi:hypothetical protein
MKAGTHPSPPRSGGDVRTGHPVFIELKDHGQWSHQTIELNLKESLITEFCLIVAKIYHLDAKIETAI